MGNLQRVRLISMDTKQRSRELSDQAPWSATQIRLGVQRLGGLGLLAIAGLVIAVVLTVSMGFAITQTSRSHLLDARADLIESEVNGLPVAADASVVGPGFDAFAAAAAAELHGGEIESVKIWSPDGVILYSDDPSIIGDRFNLTPPAEQAFAGHTSSLVSDLEDPAHAHQRSEGELIEIYVPVTMSSGEVTMVVEVEQRLDSLNAALGAIGRNVWLSIGFGVAVLAVFLTVLGLAVLRASERRRAQAERLLAQTFRAQDEERRRVVGYLHDDVGQPLYRLLYGIEGSRARLPPDHPVSSELENMASLTRSIDGTLRSELGSLHEGIAADAGLAAALRDLADTTRNESGLHVTTSIPDEPLDLTDVKRTALFRAAQEAAVNARKHARATRIDISLETRGRQVIIRVEDDGVGRVDRYGLGLTTNAERLDALGGGLEVSATPRRGSRVLAWLPTDAASA